MKYRWKTRPYAHQVQAVKETIEGLRKNGSFALLMAPRTGKTKATIDAQSILHQAGKVDRVLVICPISVIGVWERELKAHCPFKTQIVVWDKDGRDSTDLPPWGNGRFTWVIMNYDALSAPGAILRRDRNGKVIRRSRARGGKWTVRKKIRAWQPHTIILDESHRIKKTTAAKTVMIHSMNTLPKYRMLLTGTPVTKKKRIFDILSQWKFLNPESPILFDADGVEHTLKTFKDEYGVWTTRNGYPQWLRNNRTATARLRKLLHAESFAVTRDECFDLPKRANQVIPVELTGHNAELYDQMAEWMIARIKTGEITEASIKLVQGLRLRQLTSGIARTLPTRAHPDGRLLRVGRDKLRTLEERVIDLWEADERIVVSAVFRPDISAIARLGAKYKVPTFELHGGVSRADRDTNIAKFSKLDEAGLFVMQPSAGSLGIDLSAASIFIWFSMTNSWVDFSQAEDRIALSQRPTIYEYLLCPGIDYVIYNDLGEDSDLAKAIVESPDKLSRNFKNTEN